MTPKLDAFDQSIIRLLSDDARTPITEISLQLPDITERAIRYRINRLLEDDVIQLCTILVPSSIGFLVTAVVQVRVEIGCIQEVAKRLAELEMISYVGCSLGNYDLTVAVHARDNAELRTVLSEVIDSIPGVCGTMVVLVPLQFKDIYHWHIPDSVFHSQIPLRKPPFFPQKVFVQEIDRIDQEIVNLLMEDARTSAAEISRRLDGISQRVISDRIDFLITHNVIRVTGVINPKAVGYSVTAEILINIEPKYVLDVARQLAAREDSAGWPARSVIRIFKYWVYQRDIEELYQFISEVIHKVPGITRTNTSLISEVVKDRLQLANSYICHFKTN